MEDKDTITVSGDGQLEVKADQAELYIRIETLEGTAKASQAKNSQLSDAVNTALLNAGVNKDDIETSSFNLYPEYDWQTDSKGASKRVLLGYKLVNVLKVTTDDLDNAGKLVDVALGAGANGVDQVSFTLSKDKEKEVKAEVLKKASEAAKEKAVSITDSIGVSLGKVTRISESNYYFQPYMYRDVMAVKAESADGAMEPTVLSPQDLTISASVSLVYEIN